MTGGIVTIRPDAWGLGDPLEYHVGAGILPGLEGSEPTVIEWLAPPSTYQSACSASHRWEIHP